MGRIDRILTICAVAAMVGSGTANASDAVQASIAVPGGQPRPVIVENGTTQSEGTYAIGTIQLSYTYEGFQFPSGDFAQFTLGLAIQTNAKNPLTQYPVSMLEIEQTGSSNLALAPDTSLFVVGSAAWTAETAVRISIPAGVPSDDGTTLVGNLNLRAPGGAHLDTPTTVQIKIRLVHPTSCLKLYDFVTDTTLANAVSAIVVNVNKHKQTISSTNPYGQLSNNLLVVNTCESAQTFDAKVLLDPYFSTSPSADPSNAVFTFVSTAEVDPATVPTASWSTGIGQRQNLCLANVTLDPHASWLATVKMAIRNVSTVGFSSEGTFAFTGALLSPGSSCSIAYGQDVTPSNPATATVTYTTK